MSNRLPPKKDVMLALLERAPSVFIHLDPRRDEVRVPPWFKKQPQLVLQVGMNMAIPIPDLSVDDQAVSCTLSFSRSPFFCYLPWSAVFALITQDNKGMVWPDEIPPEVVAQRANAEKAERRPALRAVPSAAPKAEEAKVQREAKKPKAEAAAPKAASKASKAGAKRKKKSVKAVVEPEQTPPAAALPAKSEMGSQAAAVDKPSAASGTPKRPLPPYLRIVK